MSSKESGGTGGEDNAQQAAPAPQRRGPPKLEDLKPHRCNQHLEGLIDALFDGPSFIPPAAKTFYKCLRSEPGQEPPLDRPPRHVGPVLREK
mmetsp:Transcript_35600/g.87572  ORF Transcript_35600/g.87572 Transcript_35600/m.87572 type:complete len:92 (+) Transcript_35600:16-291(+)